jgi:HSP20 family protein
MGKRAADPFQDFEHIHDRLRQASQRIFGGRPGSPNFCEPYMEPPVDVYETDGEVVVLVEMAGIPEADVELEIEGRYLHIKGERPPLPGRPQRQYSQIEIAHGPFQREVMLPAEVDPAGLQASYTDGILEVVLPKAAPASGRQVKIRVRG